MPPYSIRLFGDPVLKQRAAEIDDVDGALVRLADDMVADDVRGAPASVWPRPRSACRSGCSSTTCTTARGRRRSSTRSSPSTAASGPTRRAACRCPASRGRSCGPKEVHLTGYDLDGNEVSIEADEIVARLFQHELDHLDGVLLLERLDADTRKEALRTLREINLNGGLAIRDPIGPRPLRLAYLGTPAMAVPTLRALVDAGHDVALVVSPRRQAAGARRRARRRHR